MEQLSKMTKVQLIQRCKELNIPKYTLKKKDKLISMIEQQYLDKEDKIQQITIQMILLILKQIPKWNMFFKQC